LADLPSGPAPLALTGEVPRPGGVPAIPGPDFYGPAAGRPLVLEAGSLEHGVSPLFRGDGLTIGGFEPRSGLVANISDPWAARFADADAAIAYATREGTPTINAASLGTIGTTESKAYFRQLALRKITDPVNGMTGILRGGRFLKSTARGIGAQEWLENPLYLEAGHGNSAKGLGSPGTQTAAGGLRLQTAYSNRLQSAVIEHPSVGGIARNPAALSIRGVPFDVMTARDLAAFGELDPDMVANSPLIRWFFGF